MKHIFLALSLLGALSACGGDDVDARFDITPEQAATLSTYKSLEDARSAAQSINDALEGSTLVEETDETTLLACKDSGTIRVTYQDSDVGVGEFYSGTEAGTGYLFEYIECQNDGVTLNGTALSLQSVAISENAMTHRDNLTSDVFVNAGRCVTNVSKLYTRTFEGEISERWLEGVICGQPAEEVIEHK